MKFLLFLTLFFLYSSNDLKKISLGYLSKNNNIITKNNSNFIYLDRSDFENNEEIYLNVTIYDGELIDNFLYYIENQIIPSNDNYHNFTYSQKSFYYSNISGTYYNNSSDSYFNYTSYFFKLKKPITKYLFVSFPSFTNGSALMKFSEFNKKDENLNIGIILGVIFGTLYIIGIIVMMIKNIIKKKENDRYGLTYMTLPQDASASIESILND